MAVEGALCIRFGAPVRPRPLASPGDAAIECCQGPAVGSGGGFIILSSPFLDGTGLDGAHAPRPGAGPACASSPSRATPRSSAAKGRRWVHHPVGDGLDGAGLDGAGLDGEPAAPCAFELQTPCARACAAPAPRPSFSRHLTATGGGDSGGAARAAFVDGL